MNARVPPVSPFAAVQGRKGGGKSKGGGGGGGQSGSEVPDTIASRSTARIIDGLGEGEIGGLIDDLKSVYIDGTVVQNADGTLNFKGFNLTERTGTPDQAYIPGVGDAINDEQLVNTQFKTASPVTRSIDNATLDAVVVKVRVPRLFVITSNGGVTSTTLEYAIDLQPDGGSFTQVVHQTLTEKFGSPCEFQHRIALPSGGDPWTIRCRRITDDALDSKTENDTWWSTYTEVIDTKLAYPNTALMGIEVDAQEFGGDVPARAYEVVGTLIEVPANYDPVAKTYATVGTGTTGGLWDGTFKMAATENPAWWLRWLMIEPRYGCGDHLPADFVNLGKFDLYTIAQYCDALVPDGQGGLESRYTFNYVINDKADAYDVLRSIASVFRGFIYWGTGAVMAVADMPGDAVKLVTPANVIGGTFTYEGTSDLARHSVALVTWNDPDDGYRTAVEQVEDPELVAELGWVPLEILAYGCTRRSQAHRMGLWALDTEKHENQTATWQASWDHADVMPSGIVAIADPVIQGIRFGGRVVSATLSQITIDAPVTLALGESYEINIVMPDGTPATRAVVTADGTATAVLDLDSDLPALPVSGAVWTMSALAVAAQPFRVLGIAEPDRNIFGLTALQHDPTKYDRIEQGLNLTPQSYSTLPTGAIMAPRDLAISSYLYQSGAAVKTGGTLHWSPPDDPRVILYEAQVQRSSDAAYALSGKTSGLNFDIPDITEGATLARVRAIDGLGRKSAWATFNSTVAFPRPLDPTGFKISITGLQALLAWDASQDLDFAYMAVRFTPTTVGAQWENAIPLVERVYATTTTVPAMSGTYLIKAFNSRNLESVNAELIQANLGPINGYNAVQSVVEQPGFSGTKTDVTVTGGTLVIDIAGGHATGTYEFTAPDLGAVYVSRISALIEVAGENTANVMSSWVPLSSVTSLSGASPGQYSVALEIASTNDDPAGSPTWSAFTPLLVGDYQGRDHKFRLTLNSLAAGITPVVSRLEISIDMPDRLEQDNDVAVGTGGITITYDHAFRIGPAVSILGQGLSTGDFWEFTAKDETGFTGRWKNSAGTIVARTMDWIAKGGGIVL